MAFDKYSETIPDQEAKNYAIAGGNAFFFNYPANSDKPLPDHFEAVDRLIVPFMIRAIKKLGPTLPPPWYLQVLGMASSSSGSKSDQDLARRRALMIGEYARASFEDAWLAKEGTEPPVVKVNAVGSTHKIDPKMSEKAKRQFRSAMFMFSAAAGGKGGAGAATIKTGRIRALIGPEFEGESLADVLTQGSNVSPDMKKNIDTAAGMVGFAAPKIVNLFTNVFEVVGKLPAVQAAIHMAKFMYPKGVSFGYQVQLSGEAGFQAYRFTGVEHQGTWGWLDCAGLIENLSKLKGIVDLAVAKAPPGTVVAGKPLAVWAQQIKTEADSAALLIANKLGQVLGDRYRRVLTAMLNSANGVNGQLFVASDWGPMHLHRTASSKTAAQLAGPCRSTKMGGFYYAAESLDFGGYVPNNWTDYNAVGELPRGFDLLGNGLITSTVRSGTLTALGPRQVVEMA